MPTPFAVFVIVLFVLGVFTPLAFVVVVIMCAMQVSVMDVVDVVAVRDGDVATTVAVVMSVGRMLGVCRGHDSLLCFASGGIGQRRTACILVHVAC